MSGRWRNWWLAMAGLAALSASAAAQTSPPQTATASTSGRPVDAALRDTLAQYATAFRTLDAAAVKRVQPAANVASLQSAFNEMRALDVSIDEIALLSEDSAATRVSCRVRQTLTPKAGSRKTIDVVRVVRLRKQNTGWVIDAFER
jgi:hypothetical protein